MSTVAVQSVGGQTLDHVNKILAGIPGGAYRAVYSAMRRAGDTAKTKAGQFAAAEYTIDKGTFMKNVTQKATVTGGLGGVAEMKISFAGNVLPLLAFQTKFGRDGRLQTKVKRTGGGAALDHVFAARVYGPIAAVERLGSSRLPVEQKFGPSTAHMMQSEEVVDQMDQTIKQTFEARIDHEILRVLNGWGG